MDEKVEKLTELAGNRNRYQYYLGILTLLMEINVYLISAILPFLEDVDTVTYTDEDGNSYTEKLTYRICELYPNRTVTIKNTNSWVTMTNIQCDESKVGLLSASSFAGSFLGSIVLNFLIDRIGRKKTALIGCVSYSLFTFIITFVTNYVALVILNLLISFSLIFPMIAVFMLTEECTENKLRGIFFIFINCTFAMSGTINTFLFKLINSWRAMFYINVVLELIFTFILYRYVHESPRFYLMLNDSDNAIEILKRISQVNEKDESFIKSLETEEVKNLINDIKHLNGESEKKEELGFKALITYPSLKFLFFGACFTAFSLSFLYNGVSIQVKNFFGDLYDNALAFYSTEIVANLISGFLLNVKFLGRKGTILLFYFLGIVFFLCTFVLYRTPEAIDDALGKLDFYGRWKKNCMLIIKITMGSVYDLLYFYLIEVFPTPVRGASYAYSSAIDYLGAFIVPFCVESWKEIILFILYFLFSLGDAAIMLWICPETYGRPLPETIKELDNADRLLVANPLFGETEGNEAKASIN